MLLYQCIVWYSDDVTLQANAVVQLKFQIAHIVVLSLEDYNTRLWIQTGSMVNLMARSNQHGQVNQVKWTFWSLYISIHAHYSISYQNCTYISPRYFHYHHLHIIRSVTFALSFELQYQWIYLGHIRGMDYNLSPTSVWVVDDKSSNSIFIIANIALYQTDSCCTDWYQD